jgi:cytochrome c peroxidase
MSPRLNRAPRTQVEQLVPAGAWTASCANTCLNGFTGQIGSTLVARLGRHIDRRLADLGRLLWFDPITGLNDDNACGGCHSPTNGFGDTQSIAIGIDNNGIVGPGRHGPRNQRRTPMVLNAAFFPTLMWNSRFAALSGDPFNNRLGFEFPQPEGRSLSYLPQLLVAQAFIPPTERVEVAGFHFPGNNQDIRNEVLRRLNATRAYRKRFGQVFPEVKRGARITFDHFGLATAEFEFSLIFADAPIDRYARGDLRALTNRQKRGAVVFFGRAGCVRCHSVSGNSNEMFSDFKQHVIGVPQVSPSFSNMAFDGPGRNEDFGLEQVTGNAADRYGFRTSPLRNIALQPAFMSQRGLHPAGGRHTLPPGRGGIGPELHSGRARARPGGTDRPDRGRSGATGSTPARSPYTFGRRFRLPGGLRP